MPQHSFRRSSRRYLAFGLSLSALLFNPAGLAALGDAPPSSETPPPNDESPAMNQSIYKPDWPEFESRWAEAPDYIRELARMIAKGEVPDDETLAQIGPEALSFGYHAPALDFSRSGHPVPYLATLLQEAVMAYNLGAVEALLAHGADPDVNHGQVLFMAIEQRTLGAPPFMAFPDYSDSLPILKALLDAGANPDVQELGFDRRTPLKVANVATNPGAITLLLNAGADPWMQPMLLRGVKAESFMEGAMFTAASNIQSEELFRAFRAAHIPPGPEDQVKTVFQNMDDIVDKFATGTGPKSRHKAWRLDQLLIVLGKAMDREADTDRLRRKLTEFSYKADGGWYLAEDEMHSRYDAPLSLPERGDQVWGP